jgi:hypothetical protein
MIKTTDVSTGEWVVAQAPRPEQQQQDYPTEWASSLAEEAEASSSLPDPATRKATVELLP